MSDLNNDIYNINYNIYTNKKVANKYALKYTNKLQKAEEIIFLNNMDNIKGKKILDIGVGGGRTTKHLINISKNYIGIDYSVDMVNLCKETFKNAKFYICDARDMSIFKNEEFDFILFSFNGIDYVSHEDRLLILKQVFRILKPNGCFVFSTHNKNYRRFNKYHLSMQKNILKTIRVNLFSLSNHIKNKKFQIHTDTYSIINDRAHSYSLLTYYINIKNQIKQLQEIGFENNIQAFDLSGKIVDCESYDEWIYYCVNK